jgi:uncharacterized protein
MSAPPPDRRAVCAVCGKPQEPRFKPFCSKRCTDVDLGRWLKGGYAIPAAEGPEGPAENEDSEDGG